MNAPPVENEIVPTELAALRRAVDCLGGQSQLARAIGGVVRQQHVWWWLNRSGKTPAEHVLAIQRATQGRVTAHELRPDLYPAGELERVLVMKP
jgi:DNA-binding transcriptional regulator YdaS (Cro superfamily)